MNERAVRKSGPEAPSDAADARALVAALLDAGPGASGAPVSEATVADALLVTSELVTNAFRHGGGLVGFEAEIDPDAEALDLTVTDHSSELPHLAPGRTILSGEKPGDGSGDGSDGVSGDTRRDASAAAPTGAPTSMTEGGFGWPLIRLLADWVSVARLPTGGKSIRVRLRLH
ncbi:ATP-binding protein [Streptomyces sp. NPDC002138]|uniref:ATP-binding protein n=1 Tax=Streptomyces sp. NPDC002138 TaxID=3154410 RepID=UPI003321532B